MIRGSAILPASKAIIRIVHLLASAQTYRMPNRIIAFVWGEVVERILADKAPTTKQASEPGEGETEAKILEGRLR
jgi:hypothetical protein